MQPTYAQLKVLLNMFPPNWTSTRLGSVPAVCVVFWFQVGHPCDLAICGQSHRDVTSSLCKQNNSVLNVGAPLAERAHCGRMELEGYIYHNAILMPQLLPSQTGQAFSAVS